MSSVQNSRPVNHSLKNFHESVELTKKAYNLTESSVPYIVTGAITTVAGTLGLIATGSYAGTALLSGGAALGYKASNMNDDDTKILGTVAGLVSCLGLGILMGSGSAHATSATVIGGSILGFGLAKFSLGLTVSALGVTGAFFNGVASIPEEMANSIAEKIKK